MLDEKPFDKNANNAATAPAYLSVWNIESYYGESYIIQDVSFNVHEGEILALLGRNGAGKTTTLRSIARVDNPELRHGEIWLDHQPLHLMESHEAAAAGLGLVPEDRRIIPGLTVEENLQLAQIAPPIGWSLERLYDLFPRLGERRKQDGVTLSGILLFGKTPNKFLPQAGIDAAAFPGTEKDYAARERATLRGPMTPLMDQNGDVLEAGLVEQLSGGILIIMLILVGLFSLILGMGLPTTANYIVVSSLMASVVVSLGAQEGLIVPLIAAHLFVFYFGIMADVTPPVGLASFAAAAVSGGDPIKTGFTAFFYSLRTVALPFLFVDRLELPITEHWKMYVGALLVSLIVTIPMILSDHHQGRGQGQEHDFHLAVQEAVYQSAAEGQVVRMKDM